MSKILAVDDLDKFQSGSIIHFAMILALAGVSATLIHWRRLELCRSLEAARSLDRRIAAAIAIWWTIVLAYNCWPDHFRWDRSLPLHMCNLTGFAAIIALWSNRRFARTILYFWALGMATQAFITPMLYVGPAHLGFWLFWVSHIAIVSAAIYDLVARDYRPSWHDWRIGVAASLSYTLMAVLVDLRLGVNYGYVGKTDFCQAALVQALGIWPDRVFRLVLVVWGTMTLMMLPHLRRNQREFDFARSLDLTHLKVAPRSMARAA